LTICKTPVTSDCSGPNACKSNMQILQLLQLRLALSATYGKQHYGRRAVAMCACPVIVHHATVVIYNWTDNLPA